MSRLQRFALVLLFALTGAVPARADTPATHPTEGLVWAAHGKAGTVYLLGSIHAGDKSIYPLPASVEKAFHDASALVVEVDVRDPGSPEIQQKLQAMGRFKEGGSLKAVLPGDVYKTVNERLESLGLTLPPLDSFKPWFVSLMMEALAAQKFGLNPKLGLDMHFLDEASQQQKKVLELEGFDMQLRLFDDLTTEQQTALLYYGAIELDHFDESIGKMMKAWRDGNAERMAALVNEDTDKHPKLKPVMDAVLTDRNKSMSAKIAGYLDDGKSYFVVVGAAHLVGPTGIVALLTARGFAVEQLK